MSTAKFLDLCIKRAETKGEKEDKAYEINGKRYENYIDNEAFSAFIDEMRTSFYPIYENYKNGSGDELGIKRKGPYPPKMASYGSSSRMIYLLAREIPGFCFEKKFYTTVGGTANMDGYLNVGGKDFYIEAKCREPYNVRAKTVDRKYEDLYHYLDELPTLDFGCKTNVVDAKQMAVRFFAGGKEIERFDIKQMICHLLGIATEKLTSPTEDRVMFTYLLFNPTKIEIEKGREGEKLLAAYRQEGEECDRIPFADLYRAIVSYLVEKTDINVERSANIEQIASNFAFARCDQTTFVRGLS